MGLFQSPDATIGGKPILGAPNIAITGFEQVGITPPEGRNDITGMLTDIVSFTTGSHQLRFGGEVRQGRVDEFYFRRSLGNFAFDGTQGPWAGSCATGDTQCNDVLALADFWRAMFRPRIFRWEMRSARCWSMASTFSRRINGKSRRS